MAKEITMDIVPGFDFIIEEGQKIGQFVMRPVIYPDFVDSFGKERESGAFGSTGDK